MIISWLKKIGIVLIELALIASALWFIVQKKGIENLSQIGPALEQKIAEQQKEKEIIFPELKQPVEKKFSWNYKGIKYDLDLTLDQSVYEYYKMQPKIFSYSGELPANWEEDYYGMFLKINSSDRMVVELSEKIISLGKKHKLNDDQIVDLILAFVQSIEYDDAKAKNILDQIGKETMLMPYEIIFQQKGVCSDKSLLAIAILRQLGYGTAIFTYPQDNHMAIGIQCPQDYSTYGSGYCYAETTSIGNKIGIIPEFDPASNKTVTIKELPSLDANQSQQSNSQQLGEVTIFQKTFGNQYSGIIQTKKNANEIENLKKTINEMLPKLQIQQKLIASQEKQLKNLKDDLESHQENQNIEKYNSLVEKYNDLLLIYKKDVKKYNESGALYNKTIARYNVLIKQ